MSAFVNFAPDAIGVAADFNLSSPNIFNELFVLGGKPEDQERIEALKPNWSLEDEKRVAVNDSIRAKQRAQLNKAKGLGFRWKQLQKWNQEEEEKQTKANAARAERHDRLIASLRQGSESGLNEAAIDSIVDMQHATLTLASLQHVRLARADPVSYTHLTLPTTPYV